MHSFQLIFSHLWKYSVVKMHTVYRPQSRSWSKTTTLVLFENGLCYPRVYKEPLKYSFLFIKHVCLSKCQRFARYFILTNYNQKDVYLNRYFHLHRFSLHFDSTDCCATGGFCHVYKANKKLMNKFYADLLT